MRDPLANSVFVVITLEEQSFVVIHARPVVEFLSRVIPHGCGFSGAMRVPVLHRDEIFILDCIGRCKPKRMGLDNSINRTPDIDDSIAPFQQFLCLIGVVQLDPPLGGPSCLVDMDSSDRSARRIRVGSANGMVKDGDFMGARNIVEKEFLDLGIIDFLDVFVVHKLLLFRWHILYGLEGILVQIELALSAANVIYLHLHHVFSKVALRLTLGWCLDIIMRLRPIRGFFEEVQLCLDGSSRDIGGVLCPGKGRGGGGLGGGGRHGGDGDTLIGQKALYCVLNRRFWRIWSSGLFIAGARPSTYTRHSTGWRNAVEHAMRGLLEIDRAESTSLIVAGRGLNFAAVIFPNPHSPLPRQSFCRLLLGVQSRWITNTNQPRCIIPKEWPEM